MLMQICKQFGPRSGQTICLLKAWPDLDPNCWHFLGKFLQPICEKLTFWKKVPENNKTCKIIRHAKSQRNMSPCLLIHRKYSIYRYSSILPKNIFLKLSSAYYICCMCKINLLQIKNIFCQALSAKGGAQWLSGRVLDLRPRGRGFKPHQHHCVVSLSENINPSFILVQTRKTCPFITERLLMGRKESNQIICKGYPQVFVATSRERVNLWTKKLFVYLIWFFTSQSTIFQLCQDESSWVEPVLSKDNCFLLKDTTQWQRWGSKQQPFGP